MPVSLNSPAILRGITQEKTAALAASGLPTLSEMAAMTREDYMNCLRRTFNGGTRTVALASSQPANHGRGSNAFATCQYYRGKVYFAPQQSTTMSIWTIATNTWEHIDPTTFGLTAFGTDAFGSCVMTPDGLFVMVPYTAAAFYVYDTNTGVMYQSANHGETGPAFGGAALASDGRTVVCSPYASLYWGKFDAATRVYTRWTAHATGSGQAFECCVWQPGDVFVAAPLSATAVQKITLSSGTIVNSNVHGRGTLAYQGVVPMLDGRILLVPFNSTNFDYYDPSAGSGAGWSAGPAHAVGATGHWCGGRMLTDGRILCFARGLAVTTVPHALFDPIAGTYTAGPAHGTGVTAPGIGGCRIPGGKYITAAYKAAAPQIIEGWAATAFDEELCTHPMFAGYH